MKSHLSMALLVGTLVAPVAAQQAGDLGSITIGRSVTANGEPLAAGTYEIRVTDRSAEPVVVGQAADLERWVEFRQGGEVRGREVASIVPDADLDTILDGPRPGRNGTRIEILKGNEYLRIWINRDGTNYLVHLTIPS